MLDKVSKHTISAVNNVGKYLHRLIIILFIKDKYMIAGNCGKSEKVFAYMVYFVLI